MVTVIPGSSNDEYNKARGISKTTIGDTVAYYKSVATTDDFDQRLKTQGQKTATEIMTKAAKIYSKWPPCIQDHFEKGWSDISYGFTMDPTYGKRVTGYALAMQVLINGLNSGDGSYYQPDCFCIHPVSILGNRLNVNSRLYINQPTPCNYRYDESYRLITYSNCHEYKRHPHKSSAKILDGQGATMFLNTDFVRSIIKNTGWFSVDVGNLKKPVQPWDLHLEPRKGDYPYPIDITQKEYWIWHDLGPLTCSPSGMNSFNIMDNDQPVKYADEGDGTALVYGEVAEFVDPTYPDSLCGINGLQIGFFYNAAGLSIDVIYTDARPFWNVFYGDQFLFQVGSGLGNIQRQGYLVPPSNPLKYHRGTFGFGSIMKPLLPGMQPYHRPNGRLTEAPVPYDECGPECSFPKGWDGINTIFWLDDPVYCRIAPPDPQFKFTLKKILCDDRGFQNWYPCGAWWWYGHVVGGGWERFTNAWPDISINNGQMIYCFTNQNVHGWIDGVMAHGMTTPGWSCCLRTQIGTSGDGPDCGDHKGKCLWILEKYPEPRSNMN